MEDSRDYYSKIFDYHSRHSSGFSYTSTRILGLEAENFVAEIFQALGYEVKRNVRIDSSMFDLLVEKDKEKSLVEIKLNIRGISSHVLDSAIGRFARVTGKFSYYYIVSFNKSGEILKHKERVMRTHIIGGTPFDWVSVEDLLGISEYTPHCGRLDRRQGSILRRNWRNRMVHNFTNFLQERGVEKPKKVASTVVKLADRKGEITIDDLDIVKVISDEIRRKIPGYFESYTFVCRNCGSRYRTTPVVWSDKKKRYMPLCPRCKTPIEKIMTQVPLTLNINAIVLDSSAIIDSVLSNMIDQGFFQKGIFVIIPEAVDQELEMMEKPHRSIPPEIKTAVRKKFKMANKELQRLVRHDVDGLVRLRRHYGSRISEKDLRQKLEGIDRHASDRLLLETSKQMGALLITGDQGLATRAGMDKVNVLLVSKDTMDLSSLP